MPVLTVSIRTAATYLGVGSYSVVEAIAAGVLGTGQTTGSGPSVEVRSLLAAKERPWADLSRQPGVELYSILHRRFRATEVTVGPEIPRYRPDFTTEEIYDFLRSPIAVHAIGAAMSAHSPRFVVVSVGSFVVATAELAPGWTLGNEVPELVRLDPPELTYLRDTRITLSRHREELFPKP